MIMKKITQEDVDNVVVQQDNNIITSSRSVADIFGKRHKHVLRNCDETKRRADQNRSNPYSQEITFIEASYTNPQNGQKYRKVLMNRNALMNVISGFTGQKAFEFRNMYFHAFNAMEAKLLKQPKINKLAQRDKGIIQSQKDEFETKYHQTKHLNWYEEQTMKLIQPKANQYDKEIASPYVYPLSYLAEDYGTDALTMNLVLNKMNIIRKLGGKWYLKKNFLDRGYACHNTDSLNEGAHTSSLKWTHKGFNFIREMLKLCFGVTELHQRGNEFNNAFLLVQKNHKYEVIEMNAEQLNLIRDRRNK